MMPSTLFRYSGNNQSKTCISPWFNIVVDPFRGYHFIVDVSAASNSPVRAENLYNLSYL